MRMRSIHLVCIDSTNTFAKNLVRTQEPGLSEPLLVTADIQTAGRGRTGKSFAALGGNSLYMTLILPVGRKPEVCLFITVAAAVAVCETLQKEGWPEVKIKWVNDLYLNDRKICGILTEAVTDTDTGRMTHAVIGVGINIDAAAESIPEELKEKAGILTGLRIPKEELAERIAEGIVTVTGDSFASGEKKKDIIRRYREESMILGREVYWEEEGRVITGTAAGIDEDAHLVVRTEEGERCLDSGYISVRF